MIQIAIWGIAFMLIVKGLDILHRQGVAVSQDSTGSPILARVTAIVAFVFALILFASSSNQASSIPSPSMPSFGNP